MKNYKNEVCREIFGPSASCAAMIDICSILINEIDNDQN